MSDYVFDCADNEEPSTIWREQRVKARDTHTCCECGHPIVPGEAYVRTNSLYDGSWTVYKTCTCCDKARCAVAEAYSRGEYTACVLMGDLWAAVEEGLRDGWLKNIERPVATT